MNPERQRDELRRASAGLLSRWMGRLAPHYGRSGSMDLDLDLYPKAGGPSHMNQFAHYPLLLLSEGVVPSALPAVRRAAFRRLALSNLRYALAITGRDFKQPLWSRGRNWGRVRSDWMIFFLQRSWRLLEERRVGDAAFRARLGRVVEGSVDAAFREFRPRFAPWFRRGTPRFAGNHAAWHAALYHEAGRAWGRPGWARFAGRFFRELVFPHQDADGFWPEGGGMVAMYGMVTAQAVSVYAGGSGDPLARAALGRFLAGYRRFALPDMSVSCVADCRMTYHDHPCLYLAPEFAAFEGGAEFCLESVRAGERWLRRDPPCDNAAQLAAFFGVFAEAVGRSEATRPRPCPKPRCAGVARLENPCWHGLLSARLNPETSSRWCLDNQNFVDLWGPGCGLLVGGGNSKHGPLFSSVREVGGSRAYVPSRARIVRRGARSAVAEYRIAGAVARARLELRGREARLAWRGARGRVPLEAAAILALREGDLLRVGNGRAIRLDPREMLEMDLSSGRTRLRVRGIEVVPPRGARLAWPVQPWNPYRQDGQGGPPRARLAWPIGRRETGVVFRPVQVGRRAGRRRG